MKSYALLLPTFVLSFAFGPSARCADTVTVPSLSTSAVWTHSMGAAINAAPVVADGTVYCGSTNGSFVALDAATGQLKWKFADAKFPITARAAVAGDIVCFESGNTLYALDRNSGQERWHFCAKPFRPIYSMDFTDYHRSAPVIAGAWVWFGDDWGNVNGVDLASGSLQFQYTTETGRPIRATVSVHDGVVYFGDWEGTAYAVSISDKKLRWLHAHENIRPYYGAIVSEFVVADGLVYFGSQHDTFSPLDATTGRPAWSFTDANHTYLPSTPLLYRNTVIIGTTIRTNAVLCLDRGNVKWTFKAQGIFFTKPVLIDDVVAINSSSFGGPGRLYFLDAASGQLIKEITVAKASPSSPAVANDRLFLGSGDGSLYALDLKSILPPRSTPL